MGKKSKTFERFGVKAECVDGRVWSWECAGVRWRWCLLGHLEVVGVKTVARAAYCKTIAEAIVYTAGVADGISYGRKCGGMPQID